MKKYTFIDLCSGIGGFRQGFDSFGECELTCEIDKFCRVTHEKNYQSKVWIDDIKKIDPTTINNFDVLFAGFPCQAFSLAGKQLGFNDTRGTIFFDIANIIKEKKPKVFLMENVKNLISHEKGKTFTVIQNTLTELNYYHFYISINSQYFVPQKRERIYILGINKDFFSIADFNELKKTIEDKYEKIKNNKLPKISDILEKDVSDEYTLSDKLWSFLQQHAEKHSKKGNGFGFGLIDPEIDITTRTLTARYYKDGSEILIKQKNKNPRRLTERECARLMGYPDSFIIPVSKTQAYKQFGNSVVVPVIKFLTFEIDQVLKKLN